MFDIQWICSSRVTKLGLSLIQLQTCTFQNYFLVTLQILTRLLRYL